MFVIALSGFVVEPQNANPLNDKSQPIFETMPASRNRSWQAPDHHFGEAIFAHDAFLAKQNPRRHVGIYANTSRTVNLLVRRVDGPSPIQQNIKAILG